MTNNKIIIGGIDFTDFADMDSFEASFGRGGDKKAFAYQTSEDIELHGEAAKYIKDQFFSSCEDIDKEIEVKIFIASCRTWFDTQIAYEDVDIGILSCTASITTTALENRLWKALNEKVFWADGFIENNELAFMHTCRSSGFIQWILFVLYVPIAFILFAIGFILDALEAVYDALDNALYILSFGGIDLPDLDLPGPKELISPVRRFISGVGWWYDQPLVYDIINWNCEKFAGKFSSSVFDSYPYRNMVFFTAEHGGAVAKDERHLFAHEDTWSTDTVIQVIDRITEHMNLEYWIEGDTLYIEPPLSFDSRLNTFPVTLDEILKANEGADDSDFDPVLKYSQSKPCANLEAKYAEDFNDREASKAKVKQAYDSRVEWNEEKSNWKEESCIITTTIGRARFMFDRHTASSTKTFLKMDWAMDRFRAGDNSSIQNAFGFGVLGEFIDKIDDFTSGSQFVEDSLIVTDDIISNPKLLILDSLNNLDDAKVVKRPAVETLDNGSTVELSDFFDYNYFMFFDELYPVKELYQRFWIYNDPNRFNNALWHIPSLEMVLDCKYLSCDEVEFIKANPNGFKLISEGNYIAAGELIPEETVIRFEEDYVLITMTGIDVSCN